MSNLLNDHKAALEKVGRKAQEKAVNTSKVETKKREKRKTSSVNATSDNEHNDPVEGLSQKNILSTNETLLVGMNHTNMTAFNPPDPMLMASRMFGSDGSKSSIEPNLNATYGTTIGFILILHLVFAYQWNKRKSRREVLTSYHQLVTKKQIHRSVVALVSHPPADASFLSRERLVSLAIDMGDSNHTTEYGRLARLRNKLKSLVSALHPLTYGHLSGLPLLAYNSHLLWSCRALEALCPSSWYYARFLIALALVSYLLELRLSYNLLQTSRELGGLPGLNSPSHSRRTIKHRTMGTPTMVTAGVLLIYHACFPFVSLPILPFLPVTRRDVTLSYVMCFTLLTALSWKSHPVTCILCGISSGFLWVFGVTSFLSEPYWGSCMICWIVLASLLTLRVKFAGWLPWIDYVAWDDRGRIRYEELNLGEEQETVEEEEEQPPDDDIESRPLLTRRSESSGLRGRVPLMDMDDDIEMPRSSPSRGLQQRRGGPESSSHHRYQ